MRTFLGQYFKNYTTFTNILLSLNMKNMQYGYNNTIQKLNFGKCNRYYLINY